MMTMWVTATVDHRPATPTTHDLPKARRLRRDESPNGPVHDEPTQTHR